MYFLERERNELLRAERTKLEAEMGVLMRVVWLAVEDVVDAGIEWEEQVDDPPTLTQLIERLEKLEPEIGRLKKKVNSDLAKLKGEQKRVQELELCLAIQNASRYRKRRYIASEAGTSGGKLEMEAADLQAQPRVETSRATSVNP